MLRVQALASLDTCRAMPDEPLHRKSRASLTCNGRAKPKKPRMQPKKPARITADREVETVTCP